MQHEVRDEARVVDRLRQRRLDVPDAVMRLALRAVRHPRRFRRERVVVKQRGQHCRRAVMKEQAQFTP